MAKLWVIDVDGTLANIRHRTPLIQGDPLKLKWREFFSPALLAQDLVIQEAKQHFDLLGNFKHGEHIILTARIESSRRATLRWLLQHGFMNWDTPLIMKPDFMRKQRSKVWKPDVLKTLHTDRPDAELKLIEDYGEVRRAVDELGYVETIKAPVCWTEYDFAA